MPSINFVNARQSGVSEKDANGQLNRKIKVVREPKSQRDMVIPC